MQFIGVWKKKEDAGENTQNDNKLKESNRRNFGKNIRKGDGYNKG
jgi:hypothetical protein